MLSRFALILVMATTFGLDPHAGWAGPAYIWLAESNLNPAPEVPALGAVVGQPRMLQIWARPATDASGDYRNLRNFSLDVLADQASIDLLDHSSTPMAPITVYNPAVGGSAGRYEYVNDSSPESVPQLKSQIKNGSDAILGLGGFTLQSGAHAGVGTSCHPNDTFCGNDGSKDAFLLASFFYTPLAPGPAQLMLQVGRNGISHEGEFVSDTEVVFGDENDIVYNAASHRQTTLPNDTVDATINAVAAAITTVWSGIGDNWSTATWSAGTPTGAHDAVLAPVGGQTMSVTGKQAANHTQVNAGRLHVAANGSLASTVSVATTGAISGSGWIMADLDNTAGGKHVIDALETLMVSGTANIAGAQLAISDTYSQPSQTITAPFEVLDAATITGHFATAVGAYLGRGIRLAAITHNADSVTVQLRNLPGDYDGDGLVEPGKLGDDFMAWKMAFGTLGDHPADGDLDGRVNAADYIVWRNNVGDTAIQLGSGAVGSVPEGSSWALLAIAAATLGARRSAINRDPPRSSNRG